jgi:murein DD-endopeptidase MepM/ murein hydrolase activator NlpD
LKPAGLHVAAFWSEALALARRHPRRITAAVAAVFLGSAGATFAVANLAPDASSLPVRNVVQEVTSLRADASQDDTLAQALRLYRSEVSRSTDTADTLLRRLGIDDPQAAAFMRSDTLAQRLLLGRAGRSLTAEASQDQHLQKLSARWSPDDDGNFKRLTITRTSTGFNSQVETLPLNATSRLASGTIRSSLFAATDDAHLPDSVAVQLAEIFSGDIDFHRALRKGDRFSVVYETLEGDGEPLRAGRVLSAEFVNNGKAFQAMWFQEPASQAGSSRSAAKGGYYTLAGDSLRRSFLASPMEFSRVTSGFSMRLHPILNTWKAHLGVDYAAPTGTPVRSVADGTVEFAGVQNGYGNVVMVMHRNQQMTVYAHLSRINVRRGQSVSQGQNVGLVGATGWATGPHLHFEFRVNGVHRDPTTIARQSDNIPLAPSLRPQFDQAAAQVRQQLSSASQLQAVDFD